MTGPMPQDMRALAAQHESAAHREPFGGDKCWYESTAASLRDAAAEVERLLKELAESQADAENGWKVAEQWERTASDVKAAADVFLDERNKLRALVRNAPHAYECFADFTPGSKCTCWKAGARG